MNLNNEELYAVMLAVEKCLNNNDWRKGDRAGALRKIREELFRRNREASTTPPQSPRPTTAPNYAPMDFEWGGSVILPLP